MTVVRSSPKHALATRLAHIGLALSVIVQLLTSQVMRPVSPRHAGNWYFTVHEYIGLAAFAFVVLFWIVLTVRRSGSEIGAMFPWMSGRRLKALGADIGVHFATLLRLRLPAYKEHGALAAAIHGLGILLMTAMAASGSLYYVLNTGNPDAVGFVGATMYVHRLLANVVWVYLIGHAGLALVHHFVGDLRLGAIWSLARNSPKRQSNE